ncbi:MAG TPA: IPT/TIG domain-containing protein, partial [Blastocatellia bacterium]|nr:IPT/TIG domain-containing protein [Blastocatellia bacterium]
NLSLLISSEMWRVYAAPGRLVNVTVINPDGARSVPRSFVREGVSLSATTVSAASYLSTNALTPEAIATVFGFNLAIASDVADSTPLPTRLAGTTVRVNGILAPLFYVSPGQINFLIPAKTQPGTAIIEITSADGTISRSEINVAAIAPAIFTSNSQGTGAPAALATADGVSYYGVGNPDGTPNYVQTGHYLVLYGTGFRYALTDEVKITIGGINAPVLYAGAQPNFLGLDQLNTQIPTGISGTVDLVVTVTGKAANVVKLRVR